MVIGLTGGVASGKSTAARLFEKLGARIIDADVLAHELTSQNGAAIPALKKFLPADCFIEGGINRARVRAMVFDDVSLRKKLEAVLHPLIISKVEALLKKEKMRVTILVVPLLVESKNLMKLCQRVCVVDCPMAQQLARAVARGWSRRDARAVMAAQARRKHRLSYADDVIDNRGSVQSLALQVKKLYEKYCAISAGSQVR